MADRHSITRRAALSAACATAAAGAVAAPALTEAYPTEVQALYPAYRRAYLDMLDTQEVHRVAEITHVNLDEADREYGDALDRWHDAEIAILEAKATCRADALLQIEVMRDCAYHRVPDADHECVRAFTVAENLAALLA